MGCKDVQYCGQREVESEIGFADVVGDDQPVSSSFVVLHVVNSEKKSIKRNICKCSAVLGQYQDSNYCNYCGCGLHIDMKGCNVMNNSTRQRVSNVEPRLLDNMVPYCCRCS